MTAITRITPAPRAGGDSRISAQSEPEMLAARGEQSDLVESGGSGQDGTTAIPVLRPLRLAAPVVLTAIVLVMPGCWHGGSVSDRTDVLSPRAPDATPGEGCEGVTLLGQSGHLAWTLMGSERGAFLARDPVPVRDGFVLGIGYPGSAN